MSTSGGIAFPASVNIGAVHVRKDSDELLIYVYIGGNPKSEESWYLIGGATRNDPSGGFGPLQVGSIWFDKDTNQQKVFANGGQVGTTIQTTSVTGMYRDLRDFSGPTADVGCSFNGWVTWTYHIQGQCGDASQQQADSLASNAFNGASAATGLYSDLQAGDFQAWLYCKGQSTRTVQLSHDGQDLTPSLVFPDSPAEPVDYEWKSLGTLTVDPTKVMSLSVPANGGNTLVTVWARGLFLTNTGQVPNITPSGKGGNLLFT